MKITPKIKKFQQGGPVAEAPAEEPAPQPAEQQDPMMMLAQLSAQAVQNQDCQAALQVCQAFLELVLQGGQPAEAPAEPVFRKGGVLAYRLKK